MRFRIPFALLVFSCVTGVGAQTADISATVTDSNGRPIEDAVVIAVPVDGVTRLPVRTRHEVDQVDKEFVPKVQVVLVGTPVTFPNRDSVRHQVYSFSNAKRFELPLYSGTSEPIVFDKPGLVILGCNIHDWMVGYVYVAESPWFGKTNRDGKVLLSDVPPRAYVVRVWHPQQDGAEAATRRNVEVTRGRTSDIAWTLKLKPAIRIRRAPTGESSGRY